MLALNSRLRKPVFSVFNRRLASTSTAAASPSRRRSFIDIASIGIVGVGISSLLLYSARQRPKEPEPMVAEKRGVFTVPIVSQTGSQSTKTLTLLSPSETKERLKENEASYAVNRQKNPVFRYDTSALASNSPIEDDSCCVILERESDSKIKGDLMFFGVFDGHSGYQTSRLLSSTLVTYVAQELDLVFRSARPYSDLLKSLDPGSPVPSSSSKSSSFLSIFSGSSHPTPELDSYDPIISTAMKNAFMKLDTEIVSKPVKMLEQAQKDGLVGPRPKDGTMSPAQIEALNTLIPALSGSCALLAFLDAGRNKLHVAVTGDSRAVMGTWEPGLDGGKWKTQALSEDQTGKSLSEVQRIQSEHPAAESDTVITRGRVLGGLEPSRAFGDARYKWPVGMTERLGNAFHPGSVRGQPRGYQTPPYVTARPEVVTVDLSLGNAERSTLSSFLPIASSSASHSTPLATRFVVLATDGLYDRLESEEIVALVGAHLSGIKGDRTRAEVLSHLAPTPIDTLNRHTHIPRQNPTRGEGNVYCFDENNLGTFLIQNALGGSDREQTRALLSIPAPFSRRYRDDITVTVILLGQHDGENGIAGVHRRDEPDLLRSKL